MQAEHYQ
jgi:hypothetical protein